MAAAKCTVMQMRGKSFKGGFEATLGIRGTLRRDTGEATSLGLKTKLGLRPNFRDTVALIYK